MANHSDTTGTVMMTVSLVSNSDLEHLIVACADLTWNQVFLELDRLSRSGQIVMRQVSPGRCNATPGPKATTTITN